MNICDHGFYLVDCALCLKRKGECDYGSCTRAATTLVETVRGGIVHERRPACPRHASRMEMLTSERA